MLQMQLIQLVQIQFFSFLFTAHLKSFFSPRHFHLLSESSNFRIFPALCDRIQDFQRGLRLLLFFLPGCVLMRPSATHS